MQPKNMQNVVTWGQNMNANIKEFACISIGGLFSGVPPSTSHATLIECESVYQLVLWSA